MHQQKKMVSYQKIWQSWRHEKTKNIATGRGDHRQENRPEGWSTIQKPGLIPSLVPATRFRFPDEIFQVLCFSPKMPSAAWPLSCFRIWKHELLSRQPPFFHIYMDLNGYYCIPFRLHIHILVFTPSECCQHNLSNPEFAEVSSEKAEEYPTNNSPSSLVGFTNHFFQFINIFI